MPILKQLVSGSSQSKRRSRMDLTREMISAPLGDFRHTMHVGRSGDAFGDTSFLSSRSGEPPPPSSPRQDSSFPRSPRPGLLSRTFRSSRRSQSVNRVDRGDTPAPSGGSSPTYVKNAMSLPFLNDEGRGDGPGWGSLTSSPLRQPANGAPATAEEAHILELHERSFGELTALPESRRCYGGGMKRTESVMSFHVDLGPSMLGDILDVMQKEDDDLGYEEGKSSEGRASPPLSTHGDYEKEEREEEEDENEEEEQQGAGRSPEAEGQQASTHPGTRPKHLQLLLDTSSLSSAGSSALEEKPGSQGLCSYAGDTDSATFSAPPEDGECNFSSFMEDEDDEIRV